MRKVLRALCLLIALSLLLICSVYADTATPYASSFFGGYDSYMHIVSGTHIQAWFDVTAKGTMDILGASEVKIQRSSDLQNWTTMRTYTYDVYDMTEEGTGSFVGHVNYYGSRGNYYRAKVTFYAKNGTGTGTIIDYAEPIYIPTS